MMQGLLKEQQIEVLDTSREIHEYVREGNIMLFNGPQRTGKTLGGCIWALDSFHNKRKIYTTVEFKFPHKPLDFYHLRLDENINELVNSHIFIDELNFYLDSRASMSKINREFSNFLLQSKKQGVLLTGTTHAVSYLELRFRQNYDYLINCKVFPAYPEVPEYLKMEILNGPLQARMRKEIKINVKPYLGLYNTRHVYNPFQQYINESNTTPTVAPVKRKPKVKQTKVRTGATGLSSL